MGERDEETISKFTSLVPYHDELVQRMLLAMPGVSAEHADIALAMTWRNGIDKEWWYREAVDYAQRHPQVDDED